MKLHILFVFAIISCCSSTHLDTTWWRHTEIYDIAVWSFKDTDGDGFGDLEGVTSKLDYLKELGISTIKLSPIFSSVEEISQIYPIDDFKTIHVSLGKMKNFDNLIKEANAKGIRVILDFLINHCSIYHKWFNKSQHKIQPYTDYFIWKDNDDGKLVTIPFLETDSKWTKDGIRKQMYYHYYAENTADLDFRNEAVKEEVKQLIKFWFDKGISGLNLLSANVYVESFPNENEENAQEILKNHPDTYEFVHELRKYVDSYNNKNGGYERILIIDDKPIGQFYDLHGNETFPIAHIVSGTYDIGRHPSNYLLGVDSLQSSNMDFIITYLTGNMTKGPVQLMSEDPTVRLPNRFKNKQLIDIWHTLVYMVSKVVHIYYGQEIGLSECWVNKEFLMYNPYIDQDLIFQRPVTSAMQWDSSLQAGFTDSQFTLVPPNVDSLENNVEVQKSNKNSRYNMIKELLKLRKTETVKKGEIQSYMISEWMFTFSMSYKGKESYIIVLNLDNREINFNLQQHFKELPEKVQVVVSSPNSIQRKGDIIEARSSLHLRPVSSLILKA